MPHPRRLLLGALLATTGVLSARSAHADRPPQVFPLVVTSQLPPELTGTPEALTSALVTMLEGEIAARPLEELGKKLRCDIELSTCLNRTARSLATRQLVYGTLLVTVDGKVRVKLVRFDSTKTGSEMFQRTFVLSAKTPKRLGKQLARAAAKMFGREVTEEKQLITTAPPTTPEPTAPTPTAPTPTAPTSTAPTSTAPTPTAPSLTVPSPTAPEPLAPPPTEPKPTEPTEPTLPITAPAEPEPAPTPIANEPSGGRITKGTWALIGGGALLAAGGGGLLYSAYDLRNQIRAAPSATEDDLKRLSNLRDTALLRDQMGTALAVGGGLVVAVGVMRAIAQLDSGRKESEPTLSLVPVSGGAALVFSGDLR